MHIVAIVERGGFLSFLHNVFRRYNTYWLVALVVSISVASLLAVVVPNVWVRRHHNGLKLLNEFLARHQLGFCAYYGSILIAVEFTSEEKILRAVLIGLLFLSVVMSLFAAKWASPNLQDSLIKEDHTCPLNTPNEHKDECKQKTKWSTRRRLYGKNLALLSVSLISAAILPLWIRKESPTQSTEKPPKAIATQVKIASVTCGDTALKIYPRFLHDHIYRLQEEHPGSAACIVESERLSSYQRFKWVVLLTRDFKSDFGLSPAESYVVDSSKTLVVQPLTPVGLDDPPYREISTSVPESEGGEKVIVVLSVYSTSGKAKFLTEIGPMLAFRSE